MEIKLVTGYLYCLDSAGQPVAGVTVELALYAAESASGLCLDDSLRTALSDESGLVQFPGLVVGQSYALRRGRQLSWHSSGERLSRGERYQLEEERREAWHVFTIPADADDLYALPNIWGADV